MIGYVAEKVAARNEVNFWRGDATVSGEYDGIVTQVALDAGLPAAQEIAGVAASATTIIDELGKIVDALPSSVYGSEDLFIYLSQDMARAYVRALGGFGSIANNAGANGVDKQRYIMVRNGSRLGFLMV